MFWCAGRTYMEPSSIQKLPRCFWELLQIWQKNWKCLSGASRKLSGSWGGLSMWLGVTGKHFWVTQEVWWGPPDVGQNPQMQASNLRIKRANLLLWKCLQNRKHRYLDKKSHKYLANSKSRSPKSLVTKQSQTILQSNQVPSTAVFYNYEQSDLFSSCLWFPVERNNLFSVPVHTGNVSSSLDYSRQA